MNSKGGIRAPALVETWGAGLVRIDPKGRVLVAPDGPQGPAVPLTDVVKELSRRNLHPPLLLRFPQILKHRMRRLCEGFQAAIREFDYPSSYRGVYPIKVNQQRVVLESLAQEGREHAFGLEAGSKGELLLALSLELHPEALILCNGFKDADYIELALGGRSAGRRVILIAETTKELEEVLLAGREVGQEPELGLRLRLHSKGRGAWVESGGSRSKFGLATGEILQALKLLREAGVLDRLSLLHFHIGSQVTDILAIKEAVREATRFYCHLRCRVPSLKYLDLGGGLAVDYDGSRSASTWSRNYELEEYCRDCVFHVLTICQQEGVAPPILITESGRALTAPHAVAVITPLKLALADGQTPLPDLKQACHQVLAMQELLRDLSPENCREFIRDAQHFHDEVLLAFNLGVAGLEERAAAENLYLRIIRAALDQLRRDGVDPAEIHELEEQVAPLLICNFSVFQSVPDTWAMGQIFPVLPLSGLKSPCSVQAALGDITCDSDGRIDAFPAAPGQPGRTLALPPLNQEEPYHIGIFKVGAYQDTLGDFHNLFGFPNEASVLVEGDGAFRIAQRRMGASVAQTTALFGFPHEMLMARFNELFVDDGTLTARRLRDCFLRVLNSSTYLRC